MIKFTVWGSPVAQGRPKFARQGNFVRAYDPAKSRNYKQLVYLEACKVKPDKPLECPVVLTVRIYREIPKSFSKIKKAKALAGELLPITRPDLGNIVKGIEDSLNGLLYKDDSQIVGYGDSGKWYSDNPRVEVEVREVCTN